MEVDPPSMDLTLEDSECQDMDDGGAMMVEDSEDGGTRRIFLLLSFVWILLIWLLLSDL
jgi:hypothetical protein